MSLVYSAEQVAACSVQKSLDGKQSGMSNGSSHAKRLSQKEFQTEFMTKHQSLQTCVSSFCQVQPGHTGDLLTWLALVGPAKTFQQPEPVKGLKAKRVATGRGLLKPFAKVDPHSSSVKMGQCSMFEDLTKSYVTLPRWGLMLSGELYQLPLSEQITNAKEHGLLPTVLATDWKGGTTAIRKDKGVQRFDQWRDYVKIKYSMTYPHPIHSELRMGWPEGLTDLEPLEMDRFRSQWLTPMKSYLKNLTGGEG